MANVEHLAILKQGVEVWNEWRKKNPTIQPDLAGADLRGSNLNEVDFGNAMLFRADFERAYLNNADLSTANLVDARFSRTDLSGAEISTALLFETDLSEANLSAASLSQSTLRDANLGKAILRGTDLSVTYLHNVNLGEANLSEAMVALTTFADIDLSLVNGLETIRHYAPSTIGIDTIYRSGGKIPEEFLRGCGIPETFIKFNRSLIGKRIHYFTCMISYSSKDERFCKRFYNDLQVKNVQVWRFAEDAKLGESVWKEIDSAIKNYDKVIPVCSKNSLQSPKVLREIDRALEREDHERKNILFPITIDRYLFDKWEHPRKPDVLEKVVGTDFIGWNRSAAKYDAAFKKLLKALKAD